MIAIIVLAVWLVLLLLILILNWRSGVHTPNDDQPWYHGVRNGRWTSTAWDDACRESDARSRARRREDQDDEAS